MLEKVKTALLISDRHSFFDSYRSLAGSVDVEMKVEGKWNNRYRIVEDVVIFGSGHIDEINEAYYNKSVLILKEGESPAPYIKRGIAHFIFDFQNKYELLVALFREEPVIIHSSVKELKEILKNYSPAFRTKLYDFRFDQDIFKYKGKPIYLCDSQKRFLAEWLLAGHKENRKRMILCNLRKKFGEDFLKDIDRFGHEARRKEDE